MELYLYKNENEIEKYNKETDILKYVINSRVVKAVSNASEEEQKKFGYKPLVEEDIPEYDPETQYVISKYINEEEQIVKHYEVIDIPEPEPENGENEGDVQLEPQQEDSGYVL